MSTKLLFACVCLAGVEAHAADDGVVAHPLAASPGKTAGKPAASTRVTAPLISETSVTRNADGSLALNCIDKPNPKAKAALERARAQSKAVPQQ